MGISGLLPLLKSIQQQKHLSELAGKTLAVDAYVWLHKGAYGCATELVTGKPTTRYVDYAMHRIRLMRHHKVEPYIVFDGGPLPAKQGTEVERRKRRGESLAKAQQLASQGRHAEARELYAKCVDVSPRHAYQLIKALRVEGVQYVVAPYEADAQLAFLERTGVVDGILTEDSDLLVFGCQNVYFKLDASTYTITHISRSRFAQVKDINLSLWTDKEFRHMAMLSGCDYLEGLKGVGVRTANKLLRKYKSLERALKFIALDNATVKVPKGYLESFLLAELAFLFQRVYDPLSKRLVHLGGAAPDDWSDEKDRFVGPDIAEDIAQLIATGDYCPVSREPIKDINPGYKPGSKKSKISSAASPRKTAVTSGPMDRFMASKVTSTSKENRPVLKIDTSSGSSAPACKTSGSGRRSLAGEMEKLQASKLKKKEEYNQPTVSIKTTTSTSRFFGAAQARSCERSIAKDDDPGSRADESGKENEEVDASNVSVGTLVVQVDDEEYLEIDFELDDVEQEDGYRSPLPDLDDIRVSSPGFIPSPDYGKRTGEKKEQDASSENADEEDGWGDAEEVFSSPVVARAYKKSGPPLPAPAIHPRKSGPLTDLPSLPAGVNPQKKATTLLVRATPSPTKSDAPEEQPETLKVDLGELFASFETSGTSPENSQEGSSGVFDTDQSIPRKGQATDFQGEYLISPLGDRVPESDFDAVAESELEDGGVGEDRWEEEQARRVHRVAQGWKARYSLGAPCPQTERKVIRRETKLSPIAQRRRVVEPAAPTKSRRGSTSEPLKPIVLNLDRPSRSPSPVQKRKTAHSRAPRKSEPFTTKRHSLSDSIDSTGQLHEDVERWHKRRRISFPRKEEYTDGSATHTEPLAQSPSSTSPAMVTTLRSRLEMYRYGS